MEAATLQPLTCQSCRAPIPLGDADDVTCPSCGAKHVLAPAYRQLRESRRLSAEDARALDEVCAEIGRPDPAWKSVAMVVGFAVGGLTLLVLAIGALVGAIVGALAAAKADAGEIISGTLIVLCTLVCGIVSVPLVGEWLVLSIQRGDTDLAWELATGGIAFVDIDLKVGAVLYLLAIVPIALALRTREGLKQAEELRAQLVARPAEGPAGTRGCRVCGAPLEIAPGALAARCLYCQADSLVAVSGAQAAFAGRKARRLRESVKDVLAAHRENLRTDRRSTLAMILLGPFIAPIVCAGGVLLHSL